MTDYTPRPAAMFQPRRIVLAKGCFASAERREFARRICAAYPKAEVVERPDVPHNRVDVRSMGVPPMSSTGVSPVVCQEKTTGRMPVGLMGKMPMLRAHEAGKVTLVLGEHRSAVRRSEESGNCCPQYWHFSPYGFCPFGCAYCYLAGTRGVWFSPTVKVFLNLPEILAEVGRMAEKPPLNPPQRGEVPTAFYLGKLQDGLALDPLTGYSRVMVPFFAAQRQARLVVLTKSAEVDNFLGLDHGGHTVLSWSLNPPEVHAAFEPHTPHPDERLAAMRRCADAGYPVRAVVMPIIPLDGWRAAYADFLRRLLAAVPLERLTLGGVCSYPNAIRLMEGKLGGGNAISQRLRESPGRSPDGRRRYAAAQRVECYRYLLGVVRQARPDLPVSLCLEERPVFAALGLTAAIGRCNCVL